MKWDEVCSEQDEFELKQVIQKVHLLVDEVQGVVLQADGLGGA